MSDDQFYLQNKKRNKLVFTIYTNTHCIGYRPIISDTGVPLSFDTLEQAQGEIANDPDQYKDCYTAPLHGQTAINGA